MQNERLTEDKGTKKENAASEDAVRVVDGEDGKVTLKVRISFDPEVQAKKAKAMAKGVKRDDQVDEVTEDEGVCGVIAEDAKSKFQMPKEGRGKISPLENCRARDPMYCPYHGQAAITKELEAGLNAAGIIGTVKVAADGKSFTVALAVNKGDADRAKEVLEDKLLDKKGVITEEAKEEDDELGGVKAFRVGGKLADENAAYNQFQDWADAHMTEVENDAALQKLFSQDDLSDFYEAGVELEKAQEALEKSPGDSDLIANRDAKLKAAEKLLREQRAVIEFGDCKTINDAFGKMTSMTDAAAKVEDGLVDIADEVSAAEAKAFGVDEDGKVKEPPKEFLEQFGGERPSVKSLKDLMKDGTSAFARMQSVVNTEVRAAFGAAKADGNLDKEMSEGLRRATSVALSNLKHELSAAVGECMIEEEKAAAYIEAVKEWGKKNGKLKIENGELPKEEEPKAAEPVKEEQKVEQPEQPQEIESVQQKEQPKEEAKGEEQPEEPGEFEIPESTLWTKHYNEARKEFPDAALGYQLGDYFEYYGKDAERVAKILGIEVGQRGTTGIAMCGVKKEDLADAEQKLTDAGLKPVHIDDAEKAKRWPVGGAEQPAAQQGGETVVLKPGERVVSAAEAAKLAEEGIDINKVEKGLADLGMDGLLA